MRLPVGVFKCEPPLSFLHPLVSERLFLVVSLTQGILQRPSKTFFFCQKDYVPKLLFFPPSFCVVCDVLLSLAQGRRNRFCIFW